MEINYKEKYEKVLNNASTVYKVGNKEIKGLIENLFPELVESEDERIRKILVEAVTQVLQDQYCSNRGVSKEKVVAWLERQGEQKSINKVESKFHKGDWCIDNEDGVIFQIVKVLDNTYTYKTNEGKEYSCSHYSLENDAHLWTIKDVKDGDILQLGRVTVIFQKYIGNGNCKCYCSIYNGEFEIPSQDGDDNSYGCHDAIPATKEQRDTLMKVMTDAGYVFDFEEKKLKKIEQKPAEWHREDEQNLNACLGFIPDEFLRRWLKDVVHVKYDKPAWSEEDSYYRNCILQIIEEIKKAPLKRIEGWDAYITWLKSLGPQNKWKPSDEQMRALKDILNDTILKYDFEGSLIKEEVTRKYTETIESLYNDLKKLKEE